MWSTYVFAVLVLFVSPAYQLRLTNVSYVQIASAKRHVFVCSRNVTSRRTTCGCRGVSHLILQWVMQCVVKDGLLQAFEMGYPCQPAYCVVLDIQTLKDAVPKSEHS